MAKLACVYDAIPVPRAPQDIISTPPILIPAPVSFDKFCREVEFLLDLGPAQ